MLDQAVQSYLSVRRAAGFALKQVDLHLRSFAAYSDAQGQPYLKAQTAIEWARHSPSIPQRARRLADVARLARYLQAEDPHHEIPPPVFGSERRPRRPPYILSDEQFGQLIELIAKSGYRTLRRLTYTTFFSLLACTGLRVSEAIRLRYSDITPDGLMIRTTKFQKSRLVPLHETAQAGLERYLQQRRPYAPYDDHVFISLRRKPLLIEDVDYTFRKAAMQLGWPCGRGQRRATPHSLRHMFAVRALQACPDDRDRITQHMLMLSTYLGHTHAADTYWYLEAVPELMRSIAETCESYAYAFRLLLGYASKQLKVAPSQLEFEQIDTRLVLDFLNDLETTRANGTSSRNVRLAAIKSFMRFMEYREPSALEQIQRVLAIPMKKADTRLVRHLTAEEVQAILDAPQAVDWAGTRDRAMLHLCFAAGLRVSELTSLRLADLSLQPHASILVHGKGRRERILPLWKQTTAALRAWLSVRGTLPVPELFVNARREPMTRSGFEYILKKHVHIATRGCPSLATKRVSPHVLRHSCALTVLESTKDLRKVSLWLGHANLQTTEMYTRVDPSIKLETLDAVTPPKLRSGRFRASDKLIESLKAHHIMRSEDPSR